jgi:hypothetical protein
MEQSLSWEAEITLSYSENLTHFVETEGSLPRYKSPLPVSVLSQMIPIHSPEPNFP